MGHSVHAIFVHVQLEKHFGNPRDIEFAVGKDDMIYLLQVSMTVTFLFDISLLQCCCEDLSLGLKTDLGHQVSRPRPRPWTSGLETETETWTKWTRVSRSLETMVSRSQHWLHQFQLVTEHSLKGATNYGNRATGVGTKHAVLRPRLTPGSSGIETKTETLGAIRFRDRDRDLAKWTRVHSSLETMVSRSQHWFVMNLHLFFHRWQQWPFVADNMCNVMQ